MKNRLKKAIVFDFDGTITNSLSIQNYCITKAIESVGCFSVKENEIPNFYGPTERGIISLIVPPGKKDEAWSNCLKIYKEKAKELKVFDGIIDIFKLLQSKDKKIFLVTGRNRETLDISLEDMKLNSYFISTYTGSDLGTNKETSISTLLKEHSLTKEETIYIGDTLDDINMMRNAGIDIISAGYSHDLNYQKQLESLNPNNVCKSIEELKNKLLQII